MCISLLRHFDKNTKNFLIGVGVLEGHVTNVKGYSDSNNVLFF